MGTINSLQDRSKVHFQQGDACSLDPNLGQFGCVLAAHLLSHLPDPKGFLEHCAHMVAPNGIVVIATAYAWFDVCTPKVSFPNFTLHFTTPACPPIIPACPPIIPARPPACLPTYIHTYTSQPSFSPSSSFCFTLVHQHAYRKLNLKGILPHFMYIHVVNLTCCPVLFIGEMDWW